MAPQHRGAYFCGTFVRVSKYFCTKKLLRYIQEGRRLRAWDEVTQEGLLRELTIRTGGGGGAPGVRAAVYLLFTCFTSTKLHILTPEELPGAAEEVLVHIITAASLPQVLLL